VSGVRREAAGIDEVLDAVDCVYVAFDGDVLDPDDVAAFMPEPDGLSLDEAERLLRRIAERGMVVGAGFTGFVGDPANVPRIERLAVALGL
jgi:arginase family enzyme